MNDILALIPGILIIGGVLYYLFRVCRNISELTKGRKLTHQVSILGLLALTGILAYKFGLAAGLPTILIAIFLTNKLLPQDLDKKDKG